MNPPVDSLSGKVAFITGAGSGLGAAAARLMAACGARVAAVDRAAADVARVVESITTAGGAAIALTADVTMAEQLTAAVATVAQTWGRLDIVCANAGVNGTWAPVDDLMPEEWDETVGINLKGTYLTMRACIPLLKRTGGGSIVITSSVVGTRMFAQRGVAAYAASKAGQVAMGQASALELAKHKIRVNIICPGVFTSNIRVNTRYRNTDGLLPRMELPDGSVPLTGGRAGSAEQVARLVWYLASDFSDFMTGAQIHIDGGQSLFLG